MSKFLDNAIKECQKKCKEHKESPLDPYTVVGYYEDNSQIFCEHVMASDSNNAIKKLCWEREQNIEGCDSRIASRNNLVIVEIFRSHLESLNDCSTLSNAIDWPGCRDGKEVACVSGYSEEG